MENKPLITGLLSIYDFSGILRYGKWWNTQADKSGVTEWRVYSDLRADLGLVRPHRKKLMFTSEIHLLAPSLLLTYLKYLACIHQLWSLSETRVLRRNLLISCIPLRRSLTHVGVVYRSWFVCLLNVSIRPWSYTLGGETAFICVLLWWSCFTRPRRDSFSVLSVPFLSLSTPPAPVAPSEAAMEEFH